MGKGKGELFDLDLNLNLLTRASKGEGSFLVTEVGLLQYAVKNEVRNKTSSHDREE
jgi:hypothetical protein